MNIVELKNVSFEYETFNEQEEIEMNKTQKQKKTEKKIEQAGDVFSGFSDSDANLVAEKVEKKEEDFRVLKNISLEIKEGEFVALVGHNGSGKSTLARLLNGLLFPTQGNVYIDGMNTKKKETLFDVRKNVGMVFQNPDNQMIASIVEDDIAFGPENIGVPREEIKQRVDWALKVVGMSDYAKATPFKLSGGQKQRIAIAGMLAIMPKVLVFDESTAMLDPLGRKEVLQVAKKLNKENGITIIHITHFMDEALMADRIIVLDNGEIVMNAQPREVFKNRDKLIRIGLGIPKVMEIAYELKELGVNVGEDIFSVDELVNRICQLR